MRISIPLVDLGVSLTIDVTIDSLQPLGEIEDDESGVTIIYCRECGASGQDIRHDVGCSRA